MSSFKQLAKDGILKRVDGYKVRLVDIIIDPGFNTRVDGKRLQEHIDNLTGYIVGGGIVPPLEVIPTGENKVQIIDGHCRYQAMLKAVEQGANIEFVDVRQFQGNDADRVARIATSNEGLKLTPMETAGVYKKLRAFGLNGAEIARQVNKTATHVGNILVLADAPVAIQKMVEAGTVSATLAIDTIKEQGEKASEVLKAAQEATPGGAGDDSGENEGSGSGKKVTRASVKSWKLSGDVANRTVAALDSLSEGFDFEVNATMSDDSIPGNKAVKITKSSLTPLWEILKEIREARSGKE